MSEASDVNLLTMSRNEIADAIERGRITLCIIGLGYVGLCLGGVLADSGFNVIGADINPKAVELVNGGRAPFYEPGLDELLKNDVKKMNLRATTNVIEAVKKSQVVYITVGTPLDENEKINLNFMKEASRDVGRGLSKGMLVIVKSTVLPGTTEEFVKPILEKTSGLKAGKDFALAYCPERLAEGKAVEELRTWPEIVGGMDSKSTEVASAIISRLGVKAIEVSNPRTAEMVKLADNLWIDQSIALANQLALICEKLGMNTHEMIRAADSLPKGLSYVNIMFPGLVGGSCLSKDPYFLANIAKENEVNADLILLGRKFNESMYLHILELVKDAFKEMKTEIKDAKIAVLGLAFKGETSDLRATQAIPLIKELRKLGAEVSTYDPFVKNPPEDIVMVEDIDSAIKNADCVVIATEHSVFKKISLKTLKRSVKKRCAIVDARAIFDPSEALKLGFVWRGFGRPAAAFR